MTDQVRVALLARAGQARDQLRRALEEAGAVIVAEGDPGELDPRDVSEKVPKVFLVSLEPAIEKSLERFDSLLEADGIEVMFDDAEVTAKLDGWDLNRWARHLAGKLLGSENLPPAPIGAQGIGEVHDEAHDAGMLLQPGLPPTPAELMNDAKLEDYTTDSSELADWVPTSPSLTSKTEEAATEAAADVDEFAWDGSQAAAGAGDDGAAKEFNLDTDLGIDIDLGSLDFAPAPDEAPPPSTTRLEDEPIFQELEMAEGVRFSSFSGDASAEQMGDLDADVAALAAQLEAFEKSDTRGAAVEPEFTRPAAAPGEAEAPAVKAKSAARQSEKPASKAASAQPPPLPADDFDFSNLSLAPIDAETALQQAPPIEAKFAAKQDKAKPAARLRLKGEAHTGPGGVLILAGLGGPDAVRQLLSSLPDALDVPVLLYQHLEVGKHERLVEQLAKISKLPVVLAADGGSPEPGKVTLLPAGMTAVAKGEQLHFVQGELAQLLGSMPPQDSMVIALSGADAQLVPRILEMKEEGGLVLAQDPEVCFDATAAEALRREGAAVYPALGLAKQIASRWQP